MHTNELQRYLDFISRLQDGVLRVHQRITTEEIRKVSNQLQGAPRAHQRITTIVMERETLYARCASRAPTNYNQIVTAHEQSTRVRLARTNELQRLCRIDATNRGWRVPYAPINHNDILHHRYDL